MLFKNKLSFDNIHVKISFFSIYKILVFYNKSSSRMKKRLSIDFYRKFLVHEIFVVMTDTCPKLSLFYISTYGKYDLKLKNNTKFKNLIFGNMVTLTSSISLKFLPFSVEFFSSEILFFVFFFLYMNF